MTKYTLLILLIGLTFNSIAQRTVYHKYSETASDPLLVELDISPNLETDSYIKEEIDAHGRVKRLTFMNGQSIVGSFTAFGGSIYEYFYPSRNRIIVTITYGNGTRLDAFEAGVPYKYEYELSDSSVINSCTFKYDLDITKYAEEDRHHFEHVDLTDSVEQGDTPLIMGYIYSLARLNGSNPQSEKFEWSRVHFPYSEQAKLDPRSALRNIDILPSVAPKILNDYTFKKQNFHYSSGGVNFQVSLTPGASSELPSQGSNSYSSKNVLDQDLTTSWVEGVDGYGIGEFLNFQFNQPNSRRSGFKINTVALVNGYAKNEWTWRANSRIKKLRIYHEFKPLCVVELQDTNEPQQIDFESLLDPDHTWNGLNLQLEIVEVYPGTKYEDTAISEIAFYRYVDYVGKE